MTTDDPSSRLDHVGIDVRDLESQVAFYRSVFELKEEQRNEVTHRKTTRVLLSSPSGWRLELFFRDGAEAIDRRDDDTQHDVLGIGHLAVACPSSEAVRRLHDRAVRAGAASLMAPGAAGGPEVRAYLADPEGVLLELIERP